MSYSPVPNYLDFYDNPTYNFKLSMESPTSKKRGVIAETASIAYRNITNVTIDTVVGISKKFSTGTATEFKISIEEPYGATLLDDMLSFAETHKIRNALSIRYVLELHFSGQYDGGYSPPSYEGIKWEWPLCITEVKTGINSSGAKYDITAVIFSDIGYEDKYGILQRDYVIVGSTLKTLLSTLQTCIQSDANENATEPNQKPDIISFNVVDTKMQNYSMVVDNATIKSSFIMPSSVEVTLSKGTSILKVLESLLCSTKEVQEKFINSSTTQNTTNENNKNASLSEFFRIYSEVVNTDVYDPTRNAYVKKITYNIMPYQVSDVNQGAYDLGKSEGRLKNILDNKFLMKQYDYIFTGKNTQVLDFDMRFDFAYYVAIPRNKGVDGQNMPKTENASTAQKPQQIPTQKAFLEEAVTGNVASNPLGASNSTSSGASENAINITKETNVEVSYVFSPVIVHGTAVEQTIPNNVPNATGNAKDIIASLFTVKKSPDMITLDLEVKGDPFWLEPNPLLKVENGSYSSAFLSHKSDKKHVYTKRGEVYFIFNANTPSIDNIHGKKNNIAALTGAYRVLTVKHTFSNGFFSQKINAVRDLLISVKTVRGKIVVTEG